MTFEQFKEKFNINLTGQQLDAVRAAEGPVLLLAVPGSGKTTVLVTRLGYMIHCAGIAPESILTMTYTVAATHDMRTRFRSIFGDKLCDRLEFRTINGVCAKIIQSYERLGGSRAFDLLGDEKEIAALISAIYRDATGTFPTESDIKGARTLITYAKNMMLDESGIKTLEKQCPRFADIYQHYCEELRCRRLMDYDDQIVYAYNILRRYPVILNQLQERYHYICVDEAQDTSKIQHTIISLIARQRGNLFMVGDEDQSIYGFRAAYPEALMQFEHQYAGARVLLMEKNFRSGAKIVSAADRFISKNSDRHAKTMSASRSDGGDISEVSLRTRTGQYERIISMSQESDCETAVLYRDNESALPLIDLLERRSIPYRVRVGDLTFFSHRIVQDIRNIITFAADPYDTEIFLQIYYKLSTYLNKTAAAIACDISRQEHIPVWDAIFSMEELTTGAERGCRLVRAQLEKILLERADQAIYRIYNHMGYRDYLDRMSMKPHKVSILEAIGMNESSPSGLLRRLDELERIVRSSRPQPNSRLILSTIHSSKGLEYDKVFLIDVCDGIFPETVVRASQKVDKELARTFEEERRLFYVGVTRARNSLCLFTYADEDAVFCDDLLDKTRSQPTGITAASAAHAAPFPSSAAKPTDIPGFDKFSARCIPGAQLTHKLFGTGTVTSRSGDIITVRFSSGQEKKLSLKSLFQQRLAR